MLIGEDSSAWSGGMPGGLDAGSSRLDAMIADLRGRYARKHAPPAAAPSQPARQQVSAGWSGAELSASWTGSRLRCLQGGVVVRALTFNEAIIDAAFVSFPQASSDVPSVKGKEKAAEPDRCICVLVKRKLHIFSLESAKSYEQCLPFSAVALIPSIAGLFIQRSAESETLTSVPAWRAGPEVGEQQRPSVYYLHSPEDDVAGVIQVDHIRQTREIKVQLAGMRHPFAGPDDQLMSVLGAQEAGAPPLLATYRKDTGRLQVFWHHSGSGAPPAEVSSGRSRTISFGMTAMRKTPSAGEKHGNADMELDKDPAALGGRQPPRKSARLEHDRRTRYYGSITGDAAGDRNRRVSSATSRSNRISSAFDELQSGVGPAATMAELADDIVRQNHGDALMEDSFMLDHGPRPSLTRRTSSDRRMGPRATLTAPRPRVSRLSTGPPTRRSSTSLKLDAPESQSLAMSREASEANTALSVDDEAASTWSFVACIREIGVAPQSSPRLRLTAGSSDLWSLVIEGVEGEQDKSLHVWWSETGGEYRITQEAPEEAPIARPRRGAQAPPSVDSRSDTSLSLAGLRFGDEELRTVLQAGRYRLPALCGQRFDRDLRLQEVVRLLDSSQPQFAQLGKRDGV